MQCPMPNCQKGLLSAEAACASDLVTERGRALENASAAFDLCMKELTAMAVAGTENLGFSSGAVATA